MLRRGELLGGLSRQDDREVKEASHAVLAGSAAEFAASARAQGVAPRGEPCSVRP